MSLPLSLLVSDEKLSVVQIVSLWILSRVSLDLDFRSLIMRCLGVDFFILFVCV